MTCQVSGEENRSRQVMVGVSLIADLLGEPAGVWDLLRIWLAGGWV